ncbi:MAG: glycosyltransferase family 2 protein [Candidatus Levybacteria bacterium]|nr:glycosyltransferase family 2 protein [Candidatus Levybacteria bacterium]
MNKIFIIIPIFNEYKIINKILFDLNSKGYKNVIVVDDGSTDKTESTIEKADIIYVRHAINRGKGAAIKTGLEAAKILKATSVITMDGDGQHDVVDIPKLLRELEKGYDVVLGYRNFESKQMPLLKIVSNKIANIFVWMLYGIYVKDSQCGFRAYSSNAIDKIETHADFYEFDSEIIKEIKHKKLRYSQVKVSTKYTKYSTQKKYKQHPINGLKMIYRMIKSL